MKIKAIRFIIVFLAISLQSKSQHGSLDSMSAIGLWKNATLKNIEYQISLAKQEKEQSFYMKVLQSSKEFITTQSQSTGLRQSFFNQVLNDADSNLGWPSGKFYLVESYNNGEGFSAMINLYILDTSKVNYTYKLKFNKWELYEKRQIDEPIASLFTEIRDFFCNEYFKDEILIITFFCQKKIFSKALLFPCSKDFKQIKRTFFAN